MFACAAEAHQTGGGSTSGSELRHHLLGLSFWCQVLRGKLREPGFHYGKNRPLGSGAPSLASHDEANRPMESADLGFAGYVSKWVSLQTVFCFLPRKL